MSGNNDKPSTVVAGSSLSLKAELDKAKYKVGETVKVKMALTNVSNKAVKLMFPTPQIFDFSIEGVDFSFCYVWSSDKVFAQVITERTLNPQETIQQTLEWASNSRAHT